MAWDIQTRIFRRFSELGGMCADGDGADNTVQLNTVPDVCTIHRMTAHLLVPLKEQARSVCSYVATCVMSRRMVSASRPVFSSPTRSTSSGFTCS